MESGRNWEEGVPLIFAIRESIQDTLGFSSFQLVLGHEVRGPLAVFRETWQNGNMEVPLSVYVDKFKARLKRVAEIAQEILSQGQQKMKIE